MVTGQARWKEIMHGPITRQEASAMEDRLLQNVLSTACAIEALEEILITKGILEKDQLLKAVGELLKLKKEQAAAAQVSQGGSNGS